MKLAICLLAFSTAAMAGGMPQDPKPPAKVRPCDPVPCQAVPCEVQACAPQPCSAVPCEPVYREIYVTEPGFYRPGAWLAGAGLSWYDPGKTDLSWLHSRVDPHAEIDHDSQFGLTAAGGYRFPSGIHILGAVTRYEGGGGSVTWKEYVRNSEATDTRVKSGDSWSVQAIVMFELGRK